MNYLFSPRNSAEEINKNKINETNKVLYVRYNEFCLCYLAPEIESIGE